MILNLEELGSLGAALTEPPGVLVAVAQVAGNLSCLQIRIFLLEGFLDGLLAFLEKNLLHSGQVYIISGESRQGGYVGQLGGVHVR